MSDPVRGDENVEVTVCLAPGEKMTPEKEAAIQVIKEAALRELKKRFPDMGDEEKMPCGHGITSLGYSCKECSENAERGFKYEADVATQAIAAKEKAEAEVDRLRGRVADLERELEEEINPWFPMSSAPKDGTVIEGYFGGAEMWKVYWFNGITGGAPGGSGPGWAYEEDDMPSETPYQWREVRTPPPSDADKAGKENEG